MFLSLNSSKLYKDWLNNGLIMVSPNSCEMLRCSTKVRNIILIDGKKKFLTYYPEYEGTKVTTNQILIFYLKKVYLLDYDKFDDNGLRHDKS